MLWHENVSKMYCMGNGSSRKLWLTFGICHARISPAEGTNIVGVNYTWDLSIQRLDRDNRLPDEDRKPWKVCTVLIEPVSYFVVSKTELFRVIELSSKLISRLS